MTLTLYFYFDCSSLAAEFIIHLAEKNNDEDDFRTELRKNGGEFPDSFTSNLWRLIQRMKPKLAEEAVLVPKTEIDKKRSAFPSLCIPDDSKDKVCELSCFSLR